MDRAWAARPAVGSLEALEIRPEAASCREARALHPEALPDHHLGQASRAWVLVHLEPQDPPELGHRPPSSLQDEP